MFNSTFYPSPGHLASKMAYIFNDIETGYVLDPEAGKGDLLDAVAKRFQHNGSYRAPKLYAVEIEPDLRAILYEKGYPIVGEDFLAYWPVIQFTHILMNPPFDHAEDHLLHAWEILVKGKIACIYPKAALEGKTAKERQVLALIEDHGGKVEDIGQPFAKGAERPTNVECVIITLDKTPEQPLDDMHFDVRNDRRAAPDFSDYTGQEVTLNSFVGDLLAAYNASIGGFAAYSEQRQRITRYVQPFASYYDGDGRKSPLEEADKQKDPVPRYNTFVELVTASAWSQVLNHPAFQRILTKRAREMFNEFLRKQKRVDFNEYNVRAMFAHLVSRQDELLNAAITDAFDNMTRWHEENREHFEGWKSNEAYRVKSRCILPNAVRYSGYTGFDIEYGRSQELNDIDRALCVVAGRDYDEIVTIRQAINSDHKAREAFSSFFKLRWFQKGTLHLYWLDEQLRQDFNVAAARGKGWLPPAKGAFS